MTSHSYTIEQGSLLYGYSGRIVQLTAVEKTRLPILSCRLLDYVGKRLQRTWFLYDRVACVRGTVVGVYVA